MCNPSHTAYGTHGVYFDVLVEDLSPALGEELRAELEHTLRQPLRGRIEVLEQLQTMVDALAA